MKHKNIAFLCLLATFGAQTKLFARTAEMAQFVAANKQTDTIYSSETGIPADKEAKMKNLVKNMLIGEGKPQEDAKKLVIEIRNTINNLEKSGNKIETIKHLEDVKHILVKCSETSGMLGFAPWLELQNSSSCIALLGPDFLSDIYEKFDNTTFLGRL